MPWQNDYADSLTSIKLGEKIEVLTPGRVGRSIEITALYDENHSPIDSTPHPYMTFYAKTSEPLLAGDIIRAAE
jgi:hypothetical protein